MSVFSSLLGFAQTNWSEISNLEENLSRHIGAIGIVYFIIVIIGALVDVGLILYWRGRFFQWTQHLSRLEWRPWYWKDILHLVLFLLLLNVGFMASQPLFERFFPNVWNEASFFVVAQSVVFHWAGLIAVMFVLWRRHMPWKSAFGLDFRHSFKRIAQGFVFLLAVMPVLIFYTVLYHLGLQFTGHETQLQDVAFVISDETSTAVKIYFVLLAVLIAPCFEEILFRGIGLPVLTKRFGLAPAIFMTALIFAFIHAHVPSLVPLFLLSIALSLAYIYTESLLVPIVMHGLFNAITVTMLLGIQ